MFSINFTIKKVFVLGERNQCVIVVLTVHREPYSTYHTLMNNVRRSK